MKLLMDGREMTLASYLLFLQYSQPKGRLRKSTTAQWQQIPWVALFSFVNKQLHKTM